MKHEQSLLDLMVMIDLMSESEKAQKVYVFFVQCSCLVMTSSLTGNEKQDKKLESVGRSLLGFEQQTFSLQ